MTREEALEGYDTWFETEQEADTFRDGMIQAGLSPGEIAQAYCHSETLKWKIYYTQEELNRMNAESAAQREALEEAKRRKSLEELEERNKIDGFADNLTPMQHGKGVSFLNKVKLFKGKTLTVKEKIRELVANGKVVGTYEEDVIKPMSRLCFNRATGKEQDAHEKRVQEAGKKTVYLVGGWELGKIGYDYAKHLVERRTHDN